MATQGRGRAIPPTPKAGSAESNQTGKKTKSFTLNSQPQSKSSNANDEAQSAFVFVDGQRHRQDRGTRSLIRTHVMRNYLQQTSTEQSSEDSHLPQSPAIRNVVGQRQKFKLTTTRLEPVRSTPSRPKPSASSRARNAQAKSRRPGEGAFQIEVVKPASGTGVSISRGEELDWEQPAGGADALADEDFGWLEELASHVDGSFLGVTTAEERSPSVTSKIHPAFASLQSWEEQLMNLSAISSPNDIVGFTRTRLDPFNSLPVILDPSTEVLVDRFQSSFVASWCPISPASGWFGFAISDAALFHGTLFHWGAHKLKASESSAADSAELLSHKLEALRLVNDRIADPQQNVTDETIAAVACLANVETSFGSIDASNVHMAGLERMISMRGGLSNLGFNGLLQRLIHWIDSGNATLLGVPLRFPAFNPARVTVTADGFTPITSPCQGGMADRFSLPPCPQGSPSTEHWSGFISRDVLHVFDEIKRLSELLDSTPSTSRNEDERRDLSDSLSIVERKSLAFTTVPASSRNHREPSPESDTEDLVSEVCSLAALIYVHLSLRGVAVSSVVIERLATRLQHKLSQFRDLVAAWHVAPRILTWILVTGAIAATNRPERPWFVAQLADLNQSVMVGSWDEFKEWLRSFLFLESGNEGKIRGVWGEVELVLDSLEGRGARFLTVGLADWVER